MPGSSCSQHEDSNPNARHLCERKFLVFEISTNASFYSESHLLVWPQFFLEELWLDFDELYAPMEKLVAVATHGFANNSESLLKQCEIRQWTFSERPAGWRVRNRSTTCRDSSWKTKASSTLVMRRLNVSVLSSKRCAAGCLKRFLEIERVLSPPGNGRQPRCMQWSSGPMDRHFIF